MEIAAQLTFSATTYQGHIVNQPISPYKYSPLSERNNEFRLIRLEPSKDLASPIRAYLQHHSLLDPPPYIALSYEVGNPGSYNLIDLDGMQVPISANLFSALHHLRQHGFLLLWVDSLCIDQSSAEEKNSQILRIQVIYQEARQVAVWLGPDALGSWKVMRHIRSPANGQTRQQRLASTSKRQQDKELLPELRAFFLRSYWQRVWMIQEIVAGSRVSLFCGWEHAEWEDLERLVHRLSDNGIGDTLPMKAVECLVKFRNDRIEGCPMGLLEILHRSSLSKSTFAKDKIYAMLRLAFDRSTFLSEPRYGWRDEELCMRMTKSFISSKRSLDIIFVGTKSQRSSLTLPSWCPDFTAFPSWPRLRPIVRYVSGQDEKTRLGVHGRRWKTTDSLTLSDRVCTINQGLLRVKGVWVATVDDVANVIGEPKVAEAANRQFWEISGPSERKRDGLGRMLFMYSKDYKRHRKHPGIFNHLLHGFDSEDYRQEKLKAIPEFSSIVRWREVNKDFCVHRWPLRRYTKVAKPQPQEALTPPERSKDQPGWSQLIETLVTDKLREEYLERPSIDIFATLTAVSELIDEGLRLMTTKEGFPGWAHPSAEPGDRIYLLAGCSMPVILRPLRSTPWVLSIVGHAYVDAMMDGNFWTDCVEQGLYDVDIW